MRVRLLVKKRLLEIVYKNKYRYRGQHLLLMMCSSDEVGIMKARDTVDYAAEAYIAMSWFRLDSAPPTWFRRYLWCSTGGVCFVFIPFPPSLVLIFPWPNATKDRQAIWAELRNGPENA